MTQQTMRKAFLKVRRDGVPHAAYEVALRAINSIFPFKILRGLVVSRPNPDYSACPAGFVAAFLSPAALRAFVRDPENELTPSFVDEAIARGDQCFALCEGDQLAAYGWYAFQPTRIDPPRFMLCIDRDYVYMYKGFTHPRYRGRRLHAFVITLGLQSYLARGFKGLISYVESDNLNSLKSCARIGYEIFGSIYMSRVFGRYFEHTSAGCQRLGFRIEAAEDSGGVADPPVASTRSTA